jgi:Protein of unknown function (DUF1588)/Protein of unknown function (DUF1592)/Protein of unknown function (DUF1595)/Protein of unknown function (DUF1585)/Protein of unknown function (DUF1587)
MMTGRIIGGRSRWALALVAAVGCYGFEKESADPAPAPIGTLPGMVVPKDDPATTLVTPETGTRRLTKQEFAQTLRDLVDAAAPVDLAPLSVDEAVPFDNNVALQYATPVLVEGVASMVETVTTWILGKPEVKARIYGCTPKGPDDDKCLRSMIETFGLRAWRRPLVQAEVDTLAGLGAESIADQSFDSGAELVMRAILAHPALLYRFEVGVGKTPSGELVLSQYEIATRLSYFLQGTTPDAALLASARAGKLTSAEGRLLEADRLLKGSQSKAHFQRFHAMWLGYNGLSDGAPLGPSMKAESNALVSDVLFAADGKGKDYAELFRSSRTWVDARLAAHYSFPAPANAGGAWLDYPLADRRGIFAHASVLAFGAKTDTSPTRRGKYIRERVLCQKIPDPPPTANAAEPPKGIKPGACKKERYTQHASGSCAGCHQAMDPIGFGLENYDVTGKYREHDEGLPACTIEGSGELVGTGTFKGPAQLGEVILKSGALEPCVAEQLFSYAVGRSVQETDRPRIQAYSKVFSGSGRQFVALARAMVADPTFAVRKEMP